MSVNRHMFDNGCNNKFCFSKYRTDKSPLIFCIFAPLMCITRGRPSVCEETLDCCEQLWKIFIATWLVLGGLGAAAILVSKIVYVLSGSPHEIPSTTAEMPVGPIPVCTGERPSFGEDDNAPNRINSDMARNELRWTDRYSGELLLHWLLWEHEPRTWNRERIKICSGPEDSRAITINGARTQFRVSLITTD